LTNSVHFDDGDNDGDKPLHEHTATTVISEKISKVICLIEEINLPIL